MTTQIADVTVTAPAKINLLLLAGSPRPDGYHPLLTVFQAVDLYEEVTLRPPVAAKIEVVVNGLDSALVPMSEENLAVRAVRAVAQVAGVPAEVKIDITKSVPVAGGLAGGSADAAAALVAANRYWQAGLDKAALHQLAAGLGSDVNFCLDGGTALGSGRGEQLETLDCPAALHWVLATRPGGGLSTPAIFDRLDSARAGAERSLPTQPPRQLVEALGQGEAGDIGQWLRNDLQPAATEACPPLVETIALAKEVGALGAIVTGSGPTVAVLAAGPAHARHLATVIGQSNPELRCHTVTGPAPGPLAR
ncbi:MAG: 4-(cytidine 5'-diphospho)-2-C-methyl-D-erythritol kinase [Micrococcales bacterium]|nr:4-(cytidine 5'-diphospho)-2-C-methyl-D-erythritol kinase [Micrococcales bacterium]